MIILGIDPGIGRVGYGVVEKTGSKIKAITYGCIETPKTDDHGLRLQMIKTDLGKIIREYKPEVIGVEKLFFQKNIKTATAVGEARGVILLLCSESGAKVVEIGPGQVKQSITGYGSADKKQMQQMVKIIFKLIRSPTRLRRHALAVAYAAAVISPSPEHGRG